MRSSPIVHLAAAAALASATGASNAEAPKVVASIVPVHSLVSAVMQGVAQPVLLVDANSSPHDYSLRPSEARLLQEANIVFRVGAGLERFLDKPLRTLAADAEVVDLLEAPGLRLLALREGGVWDEHPHAEDHGHTDEHGHAQEHGHDDEHTHAAEHGDADEDARGDEHGHDDTDTDAHVWLSPDNAAQLLGHIRDRLMAVDPDNAARYERNTETALSVLREGEQRWREQLAPVRDLPYLVFHDAYQYLEHHFDLSPAGSVTLSPERKPGARRVAELRERLQAVDARCVFREPQFRAPIVDTLVEGTSARVGVLDPVGAGVAPGPGAWFKLMEDNVRAIAECLGGGAS